MIFACGMFSSYGQNFIGNLKKVGVLYNDAVEDNFIFNDTDYSYQTKTFKLQAFYDLGSWKSFNFDLIVQPQVQFLTHKLHNFYFVTPDIENYEEKRARFTKLKSMNLYAIELGFSMRFKIISSLNGILTAGLGSAYINQETERLAKGFTFIENVSLGLSNRISEKIELYSGVNIGHVSNLDFRLPNSGYNALGFEVGLRYFLN